MKILRICSSKKDILGLQDLTATEILSVLKLAATLKREWKSGRSRQILRGKILGLVFEKPSTRTRVSFEAGILHLGGNSIYLGINDIQLSRGESIEDTARTLSLYVNCIIARIYDHSHIRRLALCASVPVINALSDVFHPCQILADLLTIREHKGKLKGLKIAWVGDGNNVCNDLLIGCAKTGINITVACPRGYEPLREVIELSKEEAKKTHAKIAIVEDPVIAVKDTDAVVTDTFTSIGKDEEKISRDMVFLPKYQVNSDLMRFAKDDCIFMHCLPATRGKEVTSEIIDGNASVVWDEAENRLHVQKALMYLLLKCK